MKNKHITVTGIAALLVFITILFNGCALLGFSSIGDSGDGSGGSGGKTVSGIKDGTYTFYPRPRAIKGAREIDVYLDRIEAKSGTLSFFIKSVPVAGRGDNYGLGISRGGLILQDLDRPSRTYNDVAVDSAEGGGIFVTFQNVQGNRFTLFDKQNPPTTFEEIVLGEPDKDLGIPPLKNGTYTYFPRLRAIQGAKDVNVYLDKIVVRSGYFTIYIKSVAMGTGGDNYGLGISRGGLILQNLDYPQLAYNDTQVDSAEDGGIYVTFENVKGSRFQIYDRNNPRVTFEEIVLGEPDK